ncbi:cytochrome c biogenesis CcdA family protein [Agrococcus carbonis]|uniref:Cytochrome C biogenesis protein transmembrane region n=2 Tax=Agrococcus carbonis TaxID=684552 RepID=A0A1H1THJ3_9MICO|nr:Cytochrome C biogenesis protein transmembrane region [Agrococcus carbonis]
MSRLLVLSGALDPGGAVLSGQLLLSVPIALLAGIVSFASPCILPLVPGYLGLMGSLVGEEGGRARLITGVALFVGGLTAVFRARHRPRRHHQLVPARLVRGARARSRRAADPAGDGVRRAVPGPPTRMEAAATEGRRNVDSANCGDHLRARLDPVLGPDPSRHQRSHRHHRSAWQGALLGFAYALGLGIPFLLLAMGLGWMGSAMAWMRRHIRAINIGGGVTLMIIGLLMVTGVWDAIMNEMQGWIPSYVTII